MKMKGLPKGDDGRPYVGAKASGGDGFAPVP